MNKRLNIKSLIAATAVIVMAASAVVFWFFSRSAPQAVRSVIFVEAVPGLCDDFILGVDISSVLSLEESGVVFRDSSGEPADLFHLMASGGANYVRVRIWNDPWYHAGDIRHGFGGGNNDVERAVIIGKRATQAGMRVLVNFHYSDFWADPGKQMAPRAWENLSVPEKAEALYYFTRNTLLEMLHAGVDIGMVQIGNETNNGIAGVTGWPFKVQLFAAGSSAVISAEREFRESQGEALGESFDRNIRIAVHKTDPEVFWNFVQAGLSLDSANVVYDVMGISYYPFWHGSLENLVELMELIVNTFDVDVAVFETSYAFTTVDTDGHTNSWSGYNVTYNYPITPQGQAHAIRDVIAAVASVERGIGVFVWEPAWITVGPGGREANKPLWEAHGSGWATSFAAMYDPYDAGVFWGGSSWDNQAFFDHNGYPLPTLNLFNYVRTGAYSVHANGIDMILHTQQEHDRIPGIDIDYLVENILPGFVTAVFSDNRRLPASITWNEPHLHEVLRLMDVPGGVSALYIAGNAYALNHSKDFYHRLTLVPSNLVQNHSFEDGDMGMWRVAFLGDAQGYANRGTENVRTGDFGFRFWRAANQPILFSLEQDLHGLPSGRYGFELFLTGGDAGTDPVIQIYVLVNGIEFARQDTGLPGWGNWSNPQISGIPIEYGDFVTVGILFDISNTNGAWGTVDDVFFFSE